MSFKAAAFQLSAVRSVLVRLATLRIDEKLAEITPQLKPTDNILDVGTGNGALCRSLRGRGYAVTPIDIDNLSFFNDVAPIVYDGTKMPLQNDGFEVALLITMLHHTPDPRVILEETRRVAKRVIVIEEIIGGRINRALTYFIDSLFNFEFFGHPHTNKTDDDWRKLFSELRLKLVSVRQTKSLFVLNRVTYVLQKE